MKIPGHVKRKMRTAVKHFRAGSQAMDEVNAWFEKRGVNSDFIRSGNGISLEELEYGNDVTDEFCKWFESECRAE